MGLTTNQVTVGTSPTLIMAGNTRLEITVTNNSTKDIYLGDSGVTISNGDLLVGVRGASVSLPTVGAIYGVVASGSAVVSFAET